ncbi:MAG: SDH family Clp fold serine proteinase [Thermoleophilia bacterium]
MPTWGGLLGEIKAAKAAGDAAAFDTIRRKYLVEAAKYTGRPVILYATKWTDPSPDVSPSTISINDEDLQGFMEVIHGLKGPTLDLVLHSPGGSPEATEAIVSYLRSRFDHIRVVVPSLAMSAATMLCCAADEILLGAHSFLGPTDPQFVLPTPLGQRMVPAQAILEQFKLAQSELSDPSKIGAWLPMLGQFGPDLLVQCAEASVRCRDLVEQWLREFMFRADPDRDAKAKDVAEWLSDHNHFKTHARHIARQELRERGLNIVDLETDQQAQDLFLSIFHAATHTFNGGPAVKIIENNLGKAFVKLQQQAFIQIPGPQPVIGDPKPSQPRGGRRRK